MFSTLEVKHRYGVPSVTRETIYRSFLPQPVEHVMGPRASRLSQQRKPRTITGGRYPPDLRTRNATPLRLGAATPFTNH
jgi:hypothetical protein